MDSTYNYRINCKLNLHTSASHMEGLIPIPMPILGLQGPQKIKVVDAPQSDLLQWSFDHVTKELIMPRMHSQTYKFLQQNANTYTCYLHIQYCRSNVYVHCKKCHNPSHKWQIPSLWMIDRERHLLRSIRHAALGDHMHTGINEHLKDCHTE